MSLSLRGFAKRQDVSLAAVQKAIRNGRLVASVARDERGRPRISDPDLAAREWAANTDHSRRRDVVEPPQASTLGRRSPAPVEATAAASLAASRARHEAAKATKAEIELARMAGTLVNVEELEQEFSAAAVNIRTKILGVPSRLKARHREIPHEWLASLDALLREALEDLAAAGERIPKGEPEA